jgi:hypothetical protein
MRNDILITIIPMKTPWTKSIRVTLGLVDDHPVDPVDIAREQAGQRALGEIQEHEQADPGHRP